MEKTDLTKKYKAYYEAKTKPEVVTLEPAKYVSIQGMGDPSSTGFADKISALYPVAYGIKFFYKSAGKDFTVAKLEGLWWYDYKKYKDVSAHDTPLLIPRDE